MNRKRDLLKKWNFIIEIILIISNFIPKKIFYILLRIIRTHDNSIAIFVRYICLKKCAKSCGNNVAVFSNVYLKNIDTLELGNNVSIHPMCYIESSGGISIGNDVSIAHGTTIMSEEHLFNEKNIAIKDQGCEYIPTKIEDNVWIGAGCRILAGSLIHSGSIVAAGAVVKGSVPPNNIVGGIPAKVIKVRT